MNIKQEAAIMRIGKDVAKKCRIEDKQEALSVALMGIAKGLNSYDPTKNCKLTTYLYACAKFEVWAEWRKQHRIKRGEGTITLSLEELKEKGWEI